MSHVRLHFIDTLATATVIGSLANALPAMAALGAVIWYVIQILESKTVQAWLARRRERKAATREG